MERLIIDLVKGYDEMQDQMREFHLEIVEPKH